MFAAKRVTQRLRAGGVVRAVEQEGLAGFRFDQLETTRPFNCFQTGPNRVVARGNFLSQHLDRRHRQCGVEPLMFTGQGQRNLFE